MVHREPIRVLEMTSQSLMAFRYKNHIHISLLMSWFQHPQIISSLKKDIIIYEFAN